MGLPAPILSGPSILYLGLAAHKYSNKVHLSMFLLEEMPWMKWRESRPHSHTPNKALTNTQKRLPLHISPLQHFCPNSGFQLSSDWIYPLWHIQSAKAAVGRLADWWCDYHHQACWLRAVLFFPKKKKTHAYAMTQTYVCTEAWLHTGTVWYDRHVWPTFVMITVVCPAVICRMCFIHSWYKIPWTVKRTSRNNEHYLSNTDDNTFRAKSDHISS